MSNIQLIDSLTHSDTNDILTSLQDKLTSCIVIGFNKDGNISTSYTPTSVSNLLLFAEILRQEALDKMIEV